MDKLYSCILFFICINIYYVNAQCANTANIYRFDFNGHTYEVVKENKSWTEAVACAVARGGYLAEINNAAENTAIFDELLNNANITLSLTSTNNGGGAAYVWLGGNDRATEGAWIWDGDNTGVSSSFWSGSASGSPTNAAYTNWGTTGGIGNEPDNYLGNQNGLAIGLNAWPTSMSSGFRYGVAGQWNDILDTETLFYLIEYNTILSHDTPEKAENGRVYVHDSQLFIEAANTPIASVTLYDLTGKKVFFVKIKTAIKPIDVSALVEGIYLVKVNTKNGNTFVQRIRK
ncbi:MAG: T9SS type A sorting domain-containing protein [Flavobacteriaceae bacterium]|nr:T9SS type A sorting domain-containing protein [Flavobacteriaceae bacterium]